MSLPVASALGLCHGAGQTMAGRSKMHMGPMRALFGAHGAGQILAAMQSAAQYNPPAQQNPPIGQTNPLVGQSRTPDPARTTTPPVQTPPPQMPAEHAGDTGKLSAPVIVGGFLILLIALYFIAK